METYVRLYITNSSLLFARICFKRMSTLSFTEKTTTLHEYCSLEHRAAIATAVAARGAVPRQSQHRSKLKAASTRVQYFALRTIDKRTRCPLRISWRFLAEIRFARRMNKQNTENGQTDQIIYIFLSWRETRVSEARGVAASCVLRESDVSLCCVAEEEVC